MMVQADLLAMETIGSHQSFRGDHASAQTDASRDGVVVPPPLDLAIPPGVLAIVDEVIE
jgi:hypothetical protein